MWVLRGALALFVGGLLLWSGLNLAHREPPAALWTPDDLPALPPPERNGWAAMDERRAVIAGADFGPVDEVVRGWLAVDPQLERPTEELLAGAAPWLSRGEGAAAWAGCERALARPRFVDGCPIDFAARCPTLEIARCQRLASFRMLEAVARGRWDDVGEGLARMTRHGREHVATARSLVGAMVAYRDLEETLRLAEQLVAWADGEQARRSLAPAAQALGELEPAGLDWSTAIVGEYLRGLRGAVMIDRGEADTDELHLPRFFFDAGATMEELNRLYRPRGGLAGAPLRPAAPAEPYAAGFGWWVRNPLGKLYLDAVLPPARVYDSLAVAQARLVEAHAELQSAWGGGPVRDGDRRDEAGRRRAR